MRRDERLKTGYGRFAVMAEALGASPVSAQRLTDLVDETEMTKQQAVAALKSLEEVEWAERGLKCSLIREREGVFPLSNEPESRPGFVHDRRMKTIISLEQLTTVDAIREFLDGTQAVAFDVAVSKEERYRWVRKTLVKLRYYQLGKADTGTKIPNLT